MLKSLKRSLAGVSFLAALWSAPDANADYRLSEPEFRIESPSSTRLIGSEFSTYWIIDYGAEDGFSMYYDGGDLTISYGNLSYNTGNSEQDFIDGMLSFASSRENGTFIETPLDGIMESALNIRQIRDHKFGRFMLNDIFLLFRSFYDLFDEDRYGNIIGGNADVTLGGKLDFQNYSTMLFRRNNQDCFFEHGTRVLAEGSANASMSYRLEGNGLDLGTRYDELLDRKLDISISAEFIANVLKSDSYRIGIENPNNSYGLGIINSRFTRMHGRENAHMFISSSISDAFSSNRLAYLDAHENNLLSIEKGDAVLLYIFHSGINGPLWHASYIGVELPDYMASSRRTAYGENMALNHNLDLNDPVTIGRLIGGDREVYNNFELSADSISRTATAKSIYESPRLDYGLTIGLNEGPIRPVISASRLRDSRFFFNFVLPHAVFSISSDLSMPHYAFLTFDNSNSETLAGFLRDIEENLSMPNSAPYAMNDYARLNAYSSINGPTLAFYSENGSISASAIYSRSKRYFLELGISETSIDSNGIFFRGGLSNLMLTLGYSYQNRPSENYASRGAIARVSGRSDSLYYSISARGMLINFSPGHMPPYELNERFRTELLLGGNF